MSENVQYYSTYTSIPPSEILDSRLSCVTMPSFDLHQSLGIFGSNVVVLGLYCFKAGKEFHVGNKIRYQEQSCHLNFIPDINI